MGTAVVLGVLLVCCFIGVRSTVKRVAHGCCGSGQDPVKKRKPADTELSHYPYTCCINVVGMTCGECKKRVENALNAMEGVYAVVNRKKKTALVYGKQKLDEDALRRAVCAAGYGVEGFSQT